MDFLEYRLILNVINDITSFQEVTYFVSILAMIEFFNRMYNGFVMHSTERVQIISNTLFTACCLAVQITYELPITYAVIGMAILTEVGRMHIVVDPDFDRVY